MKDPRQIIEWPTDGIIEDPLAIIDGVIGGYGDSIEGFRDIGGKDGV